MAKSFEVKIDGLEELMDNLRSFGPFVVEKGLHRATLQGAKVVAEEVRQTAPIKSGLLQDSIVTKRKKMPEGYAKYAVVVKGMRLKKGQKLRLERTITAIRGRRGAKVIKRVYEADGPAFYARFLEYGTSKMAARPFMRPALNASAEDGIEAVKKELRVHIDRAARRRKRAVKKGRW